VERYYKLEDDDNFDIREYNFIETDEMKAYTRPEEEKQKEDDDKLKVFQKRLRMKAEEKENEKNQKDLQRLRTQLTRVYNNTGNSLIALRRYDDALRHFQRALELNPEDEKVYNL
jgi:Flp pilus assembly protein TadD